MARGKAGAGRMDTLERSERETKLAKVQPHVSFIFKFLLAVYWPENEIHCSPWPSVPWEFHLILCHFLFTALKLHWSYFNSLSVPSCSPPFHMSQPLPGKPSLLPHYITDSSEVPSLFERMGHLHYQKGSCCLDNNHTPGTWHIYMVTVQVVVELINLFHCLVGQVPQLGSHRIRLGEWAKFP